MSLHSLNLKPWSLITEITENDPRDSYLHLVDIKGIGDVRLQAESAREQVLVLLRKLREEGEVARPTCCRCPLRRTRKTRILRKALCTLFISCS